MRGSVEKHDIYYKPKFYKLKILGKLIIQHGEKTNLFTHSWLQTLSKPKLSILWTMPQRMSITRVKKKRNKESSCQTTLEASTQTHPPINKHCKFGSEATPHSTMSSITRNMWTRVWSKNPTWHGHKLSKSILENTFSSLNHLFSLII